MFDIHIYNTDILSTIFDIPLTVYTHSTLKGYFNDALQRLRVEGYFPRLQYKNNYIESGMILCENPADHIHARVRLTNLKRKGQSIYLWMHKLKMTMSVRLWIGEIMLQQHIAGN